MGKRVGAHRIPKASSSKAARPTSIAVKQTDDGLHLDGSILWFDSRANGELSFLSSATANARSKVPQVIATEETVRILEVYRKKPNALICQYNRPFSIGRLKMELLPSGSVLGGASLYVETEKGRLLYAPELLAQRVETVRQMQLKKAHTLILGAHHPDPAAAMPNRRRERERLLEETKATLERGETPVILCEPVATAQEITKLLTDEGLPVAVHDSIYRVNGVYEDYGSKLGSYTRYIPRKGATARPRVILFPLPGRRTLKLRSALPKGVYFYVESTIEQSAPPEALREVRARFHLGSTSDGPELREIIAAVAPKELYLFGPYAKRYVEELEGICPIVKPLFPNDQPTLF